MNKFTMWTVAYRKRGKSSLLDGNYESEFIPIPNSCRYWAADPFCFSVGGATYIFAELYDRIRMKGNIGYCIVESNGRVSKWKKVISESYHLSFPFILEKEGDIYIIPEAYQSNSIYAYKAISFPNVWVKDFEVLSNRMCVDTVLFHTDNDYFLTTLRDKNPVLMLYRFCKDRYEFVETVSSDMENNRNAGKVIEKNGKLYRIAQNCRDAYGKSLNVNELTCTEGRYFEKFIKSFSVEQIKVIGNNKYEGVHTYNANEFVEVIDLKSDDNTILGLWMCFCKKVVIRIRRVIGI